MSDATIPEAQAVLTTRLIALLLEYDGASYAGSQLQTNAPTVQSELERAIENTTAQTVRVAFAGRTDAGVHARGQVASFVTSTRLTAEVLQRALNAHLPDDVVVRAAADVPLEFDPRRHARARHYRYVIDNRPARPALERSRAWYVGRPLDVASMAEAARTLVGTHDFAAFASKLADATKSTVRDLRRFDVSRRGHEVVLDVEGSAFLPHQVRRMVGAIVEVGKSKLGVEEYARLLEGPPASSRPVAPPHGLYLLRVQYDTVVFPTLDSGCGAC